MPMIRNETTDPSRLAQYAALAREAPIDKLELVASSKTAKLEVLEGPEPEAVVIMRFPTMGDALERYNSDAYQKALPHRLAAGNYRAFLVDGTK